MEAASSICTPQKGVAGLGAGSYPVADTSGMHMQRWSIGASDASERGDRSDPGFGASAAGAPSSVIVDVTAIGKGKIARKPG